MYCFHISLQPPLSRPHFLGSPSLLSRDHSPTPSPSFCHRTEDQLLIKPANHKERGRGWRGSGAPWPVSLRRVIYGSSGFMVMESVTSSFWRRQPRTVAAADGSRVHQRVCIHTSALGEGGAINGVGRWAEWWAD